MKQGIIFAGGGTTIRQMAELAKQAELAGLDSVYVTEAWRSAFAPLAAIALATDSIEIGPYILNAYARSPWLAAMSAVDIDELSGGRLVLGVGTGNKHINEVWQGVPQTRPLQKMAEYITLLRKAVATGVGEELDCPGEIHSMRWTPAVPPVRKAIPVFLAAVFPAMLKVAVRVADGIALGALLSPAYIRDVVRPRIEEAAVAAGRDPAELGTTTAPFVSVGEDAEAARNSARAAICRLYAPLPHPYYDYALREQGFSRAADHVQKWMSEERLDRAMEGLTDDVIDAVVIAGSREHCRGLLQRFEDVVDQTLFVNVNYSGESTEATIAAFHDLIELGRRQG